MTSISSSYESKLIKAPNDKVAFIHFVKRRLNLQPSCSITDLDNPNYIKIIPKAEVGIWISSWHDIVDALGSKEDAREGIEIARDLLYLASCRFENLIFSADVNKPPLDQFGHASYTLKMLFTASTCYTLITPIAYYRSRAVYWGCQPSVRWTEDECSIKDIRMERKLANPALI